MKTGLQLSSCYLPRVAGSGKCLFTAMVLLWSAILVLQREHLEVKCFLYIQLAVAACHGKIIAATPSKFHRLTPLQFDCAIELCSQSNDKTTSKVLLPLTWVYNADCVQWVGMTQKDILVWKFIGYRRNQKFCPPITVDSERFSEGNTEVFVCFLG